MVVTAQLLATKLAIPRTRSSLVARPHLLERLDDGMHRKLILVSAVPGAGKTTLLSEWRSTQTEKKMPIGWVSLDDGDNDPTRFWSYCITAIEKCAPNTGVGENALNLLHTFPSTPIESVLTTLINAVTSTMANDFVLVLDDYHVIQAMAIHQALVFLLDHLPPMMHMVVMTRADPPIPLARLRVTDELIEIRTSDLRFSPAEVCLYFTQTMRIPLSFEDASQLVERTDGWIAALQLAALSMKKDADNSTFFIRTFGSHQRHLLEYLTQEVLQKQSVAVQQFLQETSILSCLSADLCDTLTARDDSQDMLQWLDQNNLFLISLDQEQHWYRYHPLFREFMSDMLGKTHTQEAIRFLHQQAACWYKSHHLSHETIHHLLAAGDVVEAADYIESIARKLWMHGEGITLQGWLRTLPENILYPRTQLGLFYVWSLIASNKYDDACMHLDKIKSAFVSKSGEKSRFTHAALSVEIIILQATLARFNNDAAQTINLSQKAAAKLLDDDFILRSINTLNLGHGYHLQGDVEQANNAFKQSVMLGRTIGNTYTVLLALNNLIGLQIERGKLHVALDYCTESRQYAEQKNCQQLSIMSYTYIKEAELFYEWNRLDEAKCALEKGIMLAQWGSIRFRVQGYMTQARFLCSQGQIETAHELLRKAYTIAQEHASTISMRQIAALQSHLWLMQGAIACAEAWAEHSGLRLENVPDYEYESEYLTLARLYIMQERPQAVIPLLEHIRQEAQKHGRVRVMLETLLLQAYANDMCKQAVVAYMVIEQALTLAMPEGYQRLFIDEGVYLRNLLLRYMTWRKSNASTSKDQGLLDQYTQTLLAQMHSSHTSDPFDTSIVEEVTDRKRAYEPSSIIEPLGEREREVLRYLAAGFANQAIADEMVIALSTVKSHLKSIYRKLDVRSRTQAVARARELHLL